MNFTLIFLVRYALIVPLAACALILLISQSQEIRLFSFIGIIIFEQARQLVIMSGMEAVAKGNKA